MRSRRSQATQQYEAYATIEGRNSAARSPTAQIRISIKPLSSGAIAGTAFGNNIRGEDG